MTVSHVLGHGLEAHGGVLRVVLVLQSIGQFACRSMTSIITYMYIRHITYMYIRRIT